MGLRYYLVEIHICASFSHGVRQMPNDQSKLSNHDDSQSEMMSEMCLLVDHEDNVTGTMSKLDCHHKEGHRHRAFSVFLFDTQGRILLQRRSTEKITFPGVWANTCCSHPLNIEGENDDAVDGVINAARRKLNHELGISLNSTKEWDFHHLGRLEYSCRWDPDWVEREIDHVLIVVADVDVSPNENEISDVLWADITEIDRMMQGVGEWRNESIAPWFRLIWKHFIQPNKCEYKVLSEVTFEGVQFCGEVDMNGERVDPGRNLLDTLSGHRDRVEKEIMENLGKMDEERLHGAMTHLFKGGGKRLRAILPRLVGEAVGGANEGHYTLGASIEIIHNFTLIHDDIMDKDSIRRGLDAVHIIYDNPTAICAGDAMLAVGFEMLGDSDHIPSEYLRPIISTIGRMVRQVASGQQRDMSFEGRKGVTEEEYLEMISGKTSAMFETCSRTGALLAGSSDIIVENMAKWGLNLGLCFQMIDDLIDITGDTATIGKPAGSDIIQGKMTLVAIHANQSELELPNFRRAFGNSDCSEDVLSMAVDELRDSGSIEYARKKAIEHHSIARGCLDNLEENDAVSVLRELTDFQLIRIN